MVGGVDDERVVGEPALLEGSEDPADLEVEKGAEPVVGLDPDPEAFLVEVVVVVPGRAVVADCRVVRPIGRVVEPRPRKVDVGRRGRRTRPGRSAGSVATPSTRTAPTACRLPRRFARSRIQWTVVSATFVS